MLQVFGSTVCTKVLGDLKKLDERGRKGIFVGYAVNGYRIWDRESKKIYVSRDVTFFGIQNKENENEPTLNVENTLQYVPVDEEINSNSMAYGTRRFNAAFTRALQ